MSVFRVNADRDQAIVVKKPNGEFLSDPLWRDDARLQMARQNSPPLIWGERSPDTIKKLQYALVLLADVNFGMQENADLKVDGVLRNKTFFAVKRF